jgi:hypothetical protein
VIGSPDPVPVVIPESHREYVIITKDAFDNLCKLLAEERLDYTFKEFTDYSEGS